MVKVTGYLKIPENWLPTQIFPGIVEKRIMGITMIVPKEQEQAASDYIEQYLNKNCCYLMINLVDYELVLEVESA